MSKSHNPSSDPRHPQVVAAHRRLDDLRDQIFDLELERHVVELELYGYTVLPDVKPLSFFDDMREAILRLGKEDDELDRQIKLAGPQGNSFLVKELLSRDPIFEEAVLTEKPLALVTYLVGESCQISSTDAHVRAQGDVPQAMHVDTPFVPQPLPHWAHACNQMWCMDDFSHEAGGTLVVPGSHKNGCHPMTGSTVRKMAISVDAPKGSVIVFSGNLWHGAGARTIPGQRIGMTVYFSRMYARTQTPFDQLISDEAIERNPPRFAELVGRNNPYPYAPGEYGNSGAQVGGHINKTKDVRG